jgi:hypothetical protein
MRQFLPLWQQYTVWFAFKDDIFIHTASEPVSVTLTSRTFRSKGTLDGCSFAESSVREKRFRKLIPAGDGVTLDCHFSKSHLLLISEKVAKVLCALYSNMQERN